VRGKVWSLNRGAPLCARAGNVRAIEPEDWSARSPASLPGDANWVDAGRPIPGPGRASLGGTAGGQTRMTGPDGRMATTNKTGQVGIRIPMEASR
jgi:hypothetical protein